MYISEIMYNKKFTKEPTEKQKIGQIGEDFACEYLVKQGFKIIDRNYLKKWGELDIVAKKGNKIYFIEVKSVSRDLSNVIRETNSGVGGSSMDAVRGGKETERGGVQEYGDENGFLSNKEMLQTGNSEYRAEDNMHPWKLKRLGRAVQSYLLEKDIPDNVDWQFDVATVYIDKNKNISKVFILEDVVL